MSAYIKNIVNKKIIDSNYLGIWGKFINVTINV